MPGMLNKNFPLQYLKCSENLWCEIFTVKSAVKRALSDTALKPPIAQYPSIHRKTDTNSTQSPDNALHCCKQLEFVLWATYGVKCFMWQSFYILGYVKYIHLKCNVLHSTKAVYCSNPCSSIVKLTLTTPRHWCNQLHIWEFSKCLVFRENKYLVWCLQWQKIWI